MLKEVFLNRTDPIEGYETSSEIITLLGYCNKFLIVSNRPGCQICSDFLGTGIEVV